MQHGWRLTWSRCIASPGDKRVADTCRSGIRHRTTASAASDVTVSLQCEPEALHLGHRRLLDVKEFRDRSVRVTEGLQTPGRQGGSPGMLLDQTISNIETRMSHGGGEQLR